MDNKKLISFKRWERGQAATEFALISPLIFGMFMIMIIAGLTWFGHDMTIQLALEGASKGGIDPGLGDARVIRLAEFMPGYQIHGFSVQTEGFPSTNASGVFREYNTNGITPAWSILGIRGSVGQTQGAAQSPVWVFIP